MEPDGLEYPGETDALVAHAECLARSLRRWTGRELLPDGSGGPGSREFAAALFAAPFVVVSHGTEPDPVLNYGNRTALNLWEMTWSELTRTPSRYTAEAPVRDERARLLALVTAQGYIDDYSGIRVSRAGRRFRIAQATVWNLVASDGSPCGQAAMFSRWEFLG